MRYRVRRSGHGVLGIWTEDGNGRSFQTGALPYTRSDMDVHLIDGTYELFRHFYIVPAAADVNKRENGAAAV